MQKVLIALALSFSFPVFATSPVTCSDGMTYKTHYNVPTVGKYIIKDGHHLLLHAIDNKIYAADVEAGGLLVSNFTCTFEAQYRVDAQGASPVVGKYHIRRYSMCSNRELEKGCYTGSRYDDGDVCFCPNSAR